MENFEDVKVGDVVTRKLAGVIEQKLNVVNVTETLIDCGWTFDRKTGWEVDEDLEWGPKYGRTGSYLVKEKKNGVRDDNDSQKDTLDCEVP